MEALARAPGARLDAADLHSNAALHLAALTDEVDCAATLLDCGASAGARNTLFRTPLHAAAGAGSVDTAMLLVERGADVAAKDADGASALHLAAAAGQVECLEALLGRAGAPREAVDNVRAARRCRAACWKQRRLLAAQR